ncbi:MAG: flippase-like domain-containing protein [Acidimicrobiaceae bacterium]|nr:flippase-like domain-containing protein [Acidimicrobiaceae bacterium]
MRLFVADTKRPRARRTPDAVMLVGSVLGLAVISSTAFPPPRVARSLASFLASWPPFLDGLWQILADLLVLLAIGVLVVAFARRPAVGRDLLLAAVLAAAVSLIVGRVVVGSWPDLWESLRRAEPGPWYPATRIALPAAMLLTASPHLTLPFRRVCRWMVAAAVLGTIVLGGAEPLGALAGLLVAGIAAAIVHLSLGSSAGQPTVERVVGALAECGIHVGSLGAAERQQTGLFVLRGFEQSGQPLLVKIYGRDAHETALLSTLWRTVWFRDTGGQLRVGRLQQVEHEALLTLLAAQAGIVTDAVLTASVTADRDALLVFRQAGHPLSDLPPAANEHQRVMKVWEVTKRLEEAGIAHGQVDLDHLIGVDGEVGLSDFRRATVAPTDAQRHADKAQALVSTILLIGEQPALRTALEILGPAGFAAILPLLQPAILTPPQRHQLQDAGLDLDRIRTDAALLAGTDAPTLQRLQRISAVSILRVLVPAAALFALVSVAGNLDWGQLADELVDAKWTLIVVGVVVAQLPRIPQAFATLGASPVPLPLGPVYALQLSVSYINLAVPGTAARIAVNIRFFQRHGVPPGAAVAVGALDGVSGLIVQVILLLLLLLFTQASLELNLSTGTRDSAHIGVAVLAIIAALVGPVAAVPRWRRAVAGWMKRLVGEARQAVRGLRSFRRLALLFGGNLAAELLFTASLGAFLRAVGSPVGVGELLLINIGVRLLAGILPIPGGVGVTEGGLIFGLMHAGVPEQTAFAATIMYRLATFYLPPIWGYFAMRWLRRTNHL